MSARAEDVRSRQIVAYAKQQWMNDSEFHARAEVAVQIVLATSQDLTEDEIGLVQTAVAVGLAMPWVDLTTGRIADG